MATQPIPMSKPIKFCGANFLDGLAWGKLENSYSPSIFVNALHTNRFSIS